jgi:nitroreductase
MHRRTFIRVAGGGALVATGAAGYLLSDKRNLLRADLKPTDDAHRILQPDENEILLLASLAPSGHNTQPWFVQHLEPFHWIIGNDRRKWLPAVDPEQRETLLSLGAFLQNLEFAAADFGYACRWTLLAATNQDEQVMEVQLVKAGAANQANVDSLKSRRTMRGGFSRETLRKEDLAPLVAGEPEFVHYLPATSKEAGFINEQTIEANRLQAYRDPAQQELANWIRLSSADAREKRDGLTTGSMEIDGMAGWAVRNFYGKADVMKASFRERGIDQVRAEVAAAGWILITSENATVAALLDTGRRMQRLFLKVRARGIGLHPMTQILEEPSTKLALSPGIGFGEHVQFLLRVGYVAAYSPPVSLRRPVAWFLREGGAKLYRRGKITKLNDDFEP